MNRQIQRLGAFIVVCFVAVFVRLNQIQVFDADEINHREGNSRLIERDFNRPRGRIVTADGRIAAESTETDGQYAYQREYPLGDLYSHVVGYYSFNLGSDGVERSYHDELVGQTAEFRLDGLLTPFDDEEPVGDLELSVHSVVQQAAGDALGDRRGSVVAIDVDTGGVLAMVSNPRFDPNVVSSNDVDAALAAKKELDADPSKPLLARSFRERYAPGSTFKVVTAAAGLSADVVSASEPRFEPASSYTPPGTTRALSNFGGSTCGGDLVELLRVSCNSGFAEMAAEMLGPEPMIATAERFGLNTPSGIDLPRPATSQFPTDYGARIRELSGGADQYEDTPRLAQAAIGQNSVTATPLDMAVVAATIARGGQRPVPHVVERVLDASGDEVSRIEPGTVDVISEDDAAVLASAMVGVVEDGTASRMAVPGAVVGGKTGTAQTGRGGTGSHAWVIGFAGSPGQEPEVAIAVLVEADGADEQTGGEVAAPIAAQVLQAALERS